LVIKINDDIVENIGKLGKIKFRKGRYVYIGSAMNSIEKRVERHLKRKKKVFWHIDRLLSNNRVEVERVYIKESDTKEECAIASIISKQGYAIKGFGSSDCKCISHLYKVKSIDFLEKFLERIV